MKNRKIWCYVLAALCVLLLLACVYLLNARSKLNETAYDLANDGYASVVSALERACGSEELTMRDVEEIKASVDVLRGELELLYRAGLTKDPYSMGVAYNPFTSFSGYLYEAIDEAYRAGGIPEGLADELRSLYELLRPEQDVLDAARALDGVTFK